MPIKLNVPFKEKDTAKTNGAKWNPEEKTWYIPEHISDLTPFTKWLSPNENIYLKSPLIFAIWQKECWKCKKTTPLFAIGANQYLICNLIESEDLVDDEGYYIDQIVWDKFDFGLFHRVMYIPDNIKTLISTHFPYFQFTYSNFTRSKYWANLCVHCNSLQGDNYVHGEIGDGFGITSENVARRISLIQIPSKFDIDIGACHFEYNDSHILIDKFAMRYNSIDEYFFKKNSSNEGMFEIQDKKAASPINFRMK